MCKYIKTKIKNFFLRKKSDMLIIVWKGFFLKKGFFRFKTKSEEKVSWNLCNSNRRFLESVHSSHESAKEGTSAGKVSRQARLIEHRSRFHTERRNFRWFRAFEFARNTA